jgi:predicted ATPase
MIKLLRLRSFKNFRDAELNCGPFTVLMGANASGKSNIRDAFRFLHGIGRGYPLASIAGEKFGPGSELVWDGIRGGLREIAYRQANSFALEVEVDDVLVGEPSCVYRIEVAPNFKGSQPRIVNESLHFGEHQVFESKPNPERDMLIISVLGSRVRDQPMHHVAEPSLIQFVKPFFSTLRPKDEQQAQLLEKFERIRPRIIETFANMRFLSPTLKAMRQPSTPGQKIIGNQGEHLSSVLQTICADPQRKAGLLSWLGSLTPMDVADLEFKPDITGKILLMLVEENGHRTSVYSASGGTVRFLALLAALMGPQADQLFFFEEIENGIHPARLHVLLDLIENQVKHNRTQVIATTHSPQLLRLVNPQTFDSTSLVYRLEGRQTGHIQRLEALPTQAQNILHKKDRGQLYESGWFENIVSFMDAEEIA